MAGQEPGASSSEHPVLDAQHSTVVMLSVVQRQDSWRLVIRILFGLSSRNVSTALGRLGPSYWMAKQSVKTGMVFMQNDQKPWNGLERVQMPGGFQ